MSRVICRNRLVGPGQDESRDISDRILSRIKTSSENKRISCIVPDGIITIPNCRVIYCLFIAVAKTLYYSDLQNLYDMQVNCVIYIEHVDLLSNRIKSISDKLSWFFSYMPKLNLTQFFCSLVPGSLLRFVYLLNRADVSGEIHSLDLDIFVLPMKSKPTTLLEVLYRTCLLTHWCG